MQKWICCCKEVCLQLSTRIRSFENVHLFGDKLCMLAVANTDSRLWKRNPFSDKRIRSFENVHLSGTNCACSCKHRFAALKTYTLQGQTDSQLWKRTPFNDKLCLQLQTHIRSLDSGSNGCTYSTETELCQRPPAIEAKRSLYYHGPWYHTTGRSGCCRLHAAVRTSACRFSGHGTRLYPHITTRQAVLPLNCILFSSFQTMFVQIINSVYLFCRCSLYW